MLYRGYNGSNDIHDKPIVVNGGLDHCHDQHEGRDQYHHPPGVTDWWICWYKNQFLVSFNAKSNYDQYPSDGHQANKGEYNLQANLFAPKIWLGIMQMCMHAHV